MSTPGVPSSVRKVPAGQIVIPVLPSPVYPGTAKQSVTASEPASLLLFAGHKPSQSDSASCPEEPLNFPAPQFVQLVAADKADEN